MALPKIYENDLDKAMFPIRVSPVYYRPTSDNMAIDDPNHKVIMRQDNKQVLGIVSSRYKIYTHAQAYMAAGTRPGRRHQKSNAPANL